MYVKCQMGSTCEDRTERAAVKRRVRLRDTLYVSNVSVSCSWLLTVANSRAHTHTSSMTASWWSYTAKTLTVGSRQPVTWLQLLHLNVISDGVTVVVASWCEDSLFALHRLWLTAHSNRVSNYVPASNCVLAVFFSFIIQLPFLPRTTNVDIIVESGNICTAHSIGATSKTAYDERLPHAVVETRVTF